MKIRILDVHETDAHYPHIKELVGQVGTFYTVRKLPNGFYQGYFYSKNKIYINNVLRPRISFDAVHFCVEDSK